MSSAVGPPEPGEIEISLFGPRYGEAIALHLGYGVWVLIDSCLDGDSGLPASIAYLRTIGAELSSVQLVVATHWHDDHIRGLGEIVRTCDSARFVTSSALTTGQFTTLIGYFRHHVAVARSGLDEFGQVLGTLDDRRSGRMRVNPPLRAIADRQLFRAVLGDDAEVEVTIHALSPSDTSVALAERALAALFAGGDLEREPIRSPSQNHNAIVLWCQIGTHTLLLGADLERTPDPKTGWAAILDDSTVISRRAEVFKVPHHGGESGHEQRVWEELLLPDPLAILTPWQLGNRFLPQPTDIARIAALTPNAYITAMPDRRLPRPASVVVRDMLKAATRRVTPVLSRTGHLRLRCRIASPPDAWEVERIGDARRLS